MHKSLFSASLLALALAAPLAQAHQAGDILIRAGAVTVDAREDSDDVALDGVKQANTGVTLDSDTQLGLNFAYMLTDHLGIELLAATPFSHDISVKGFGGAIDGSLGETKHLPPTLSLVYYPLDPKLAFQPYLGVGINYTWFFEDKLTSRAEGQTFSGLDLDDSVGVAFQVGADYMLTENVLINAQFRYIDIDTEGTTTLGGTTKVSVDVDIDPYVYMVGIGYRF